MAKTTQATEIHWLKDPDAALAQGKRADQPVLLDFSAAPM
jgi:hypothetical protein